MALIKTSSQITLKQTINMMVYGKAGSGKTTMALSAPRPLYIDLDGGASRVRMEHLDAVGIVQVDSWQDLEALLREDLTDYSTIVVDTIGKLVDFAIIRRCGLRQPTLKDWGGVNGDCVGFIRSLASFGKSVIYIAHEDVRKERDENVYIPRIREKVYASIITELDLLGYIEMQTDPATGQTSRTITFDPTPRNEGKNTCSLPSIMIIPEVVDRQGNMKMGNTFIAEQIMKPYAMMLKAKREQQAKYTEVIAKLREDIANISTAEEANAFVWSIDDYPHVGNSKALAARELQARTTALGLKYDKETKQYEPADSPADGTAYSPQGATA